MTRTIAVCIATFRRPNMLQRTLESLKEQEVEDCDVSIRVVDSDPWRSAWPVVRTFTNRSDCEVAYATVAEPNIALARNRALDMGPADLFAFIDDDEVASVGWLHALVKVLDHTRADAVFGPVTGLLPNKASKWIRRSGMFDKSISDRVAAIHWTDTRTSNALVRGQWLSNEDGRFNTDFGRSGGEDAELFFRLYRRGAIYAWAPDARVTEEVPAQRASLRYLWRRRYHSGITHHRIATQTDRYSPGSQFVRRLVKMFFLLGKGAVYAIVGQTHHMARSVIYTGLIVGGIVGWLGLGNPNKRSTYAQTQYGVSP